MVGSHAKAFGTRGSQVQILPLRPFTPSDFSRFCARRISLGLRTKQHLSTSEFRHVRRHPRCPRLGLGVATMHGPVLANVRPALCRGSSGARALPDVQPEKVILPASKAAASCRLNPWEIRPAASWAARRCGYPLVKVRSLSDRASSCPMAAEISCRGGVGSRTAGASVAIGTVKPTPSVGNRV